jgi:PDZ domain-containing secreted protein
MAFDDKIGEIGGIDSKKKATESAGASYQPPPPIQAPPAQGNPMDQIQDQVSISSFGDQKQQ